MGLYERILTSVVCTDLTDSVCTHHDLAQDLALINLAEGLYERILIEAISADRTQWGLYTRNVTASETISFSCNHWDDRVFVAKTANSVFENWRNLILERTACLRKREFVTISWYTRIYRNGPHYEGQGRDIAWSYSSSLFCTSL